MQRYRAQRSHDRSRGHWDRSRGHWVGETLGCDPPHLSWVWLWALISWFCVDKIAKIQSPQVTRSIERPRRATEIDREDENLMDSASIFSDFTTFSRSGSYQDGSRQVLKSMFGTTFWTRKWTIEVAKRELPDHFGDPRSQNLKGFTYKILQNLEDLGCLEINLNHLKQHLCAYCLDKTRKTQSKMV